MNFYFLKNYTLYVIIILIIISPFKRKLKTYPYSSSNYADQNYNEFYQSEPSASGEKNTQEIQVSEKDYVENHNSNDSVDNTNEFINDKSYIENNNSYRLTDKNNSFTRGKKNVDKVSDQILIDPNQNLDSISGFQIHDSYKSLGKNINTTLKIDTKKDIYWEFGPTGDYVDLIIRKKPKINSIMLTNMYYGKKDIDTYGSKVYGLRSKEEFKINANEKRIIGNKMISNRSLSFLIDSTAETNFVFKEAFRVRLPLQVEYGYKAPGENYGIIFIKKGVTINLRTFSDKYANHKKAFENNPIQIDFSEKDYLKRMKPNLKKLAVYSSNSYRIIKVEYFSRFDYIKYFLIRDIHKSQFFKKISFTREPFKNNTGLVIRAINQPDHGITMVALIYIKEENFEKDYEIAAVDQQNRISQNIIRFTDNPVIKNDIDTNTNNNPDEKDYDYEQSENKMLEDNY